MAIIYCEICGEYRYLTPHAFWNVNDFGAKCEKCETTSEVFDQIMNVNVKGVWLSMKYEIPEMIRTGGGAIVNTSSGAGGL